jgi:hypothetical protein
LRKTNGRRLDVVKHNLLVALVTPIALLGSLITAMPASAATIDESFGYDVSWPQCGRVLPVDGAFKIVGVNNGLVFSDNPCFEDQLIWAGASKAQLYFNTGNPGPELSRFWPLGQVSPRSCLESAPDSLGCAFNYGYNFAEYAYKSAELSYAKLGLDTKPKDAFIWLDVEIENSWRLEVKRNVRALQGAVYYLEKVAKATRIGFYSNSYQWGLITGGSQVFAEYPSWVATASNRELSIEACNQKIGFTGGRTRLTQYIDYELDLDVNVNCLSAPLLATSFENLRPVIATRNSEVTIRGKLVAETGNPIAHKDLVVRVFGERQRVRTTKYGNFKVNVKVPRKRGEYELVVRFLGAKYFASNISRTSFVVE